MNATDRSTSIGVLMLLILCTGAEAAAQEDRIDLDALAFMSGCWEGSFQSRKGAGVMEERYTEPSENLMLGTTRYLVEGRTTQYELTVIRLTDEGDVLLTPYPGGERSEHSFRLGTASTGRAVFDAPEHDFPKRIVYELLSDGTLQATIDDGPGGSRSTSWELRRTSCDNL